jgi:hypothetical protein
MADQNTSNNSGGGGPSSNNNRNFKPDPRKKIKCNYGNKCKSEKCPYGHSSTHVPYVPTPDELADSVNNLNINNECRYKNNCHNLKCTRVHPDGYTPRPSGRCKFNKDCDYNNSDVEDNERCQYSHEGDKWWDDLPPISKQTFKSPRNVGGGGGGGAN